MNGIKSICLTWLAMTGVLAAQDQDFRTDINPALRYYEAMIVGPELPAADRDYLFTNEWQGQKLPERFGDLVSRFNTQFKLVRQAGQATAPCDWGIDFSEGPGTLLPELARCKTFAQMAKLRVLWDLQNGRETEACADLIGAFDVAENASQDGTLIGVLVQFASEAIVLSTVEANYGRFSAAALKQLGAGMDAAPPGSTVAASLIKGEKEVFENWLVAKILRWRQENPGDDAKVMAHLRGLFQSLPSESNTRDKWEQVINTVNTSDGVLQLLHDEDAFYQKAAETLQLPPGTFEEQAQQFQTMLDQSTNSLVKLTFPAILKAGLKQFRATARLAICRAAIAYKVHGADGLQSVKDPFGSGPFQFERFTFQGVDRGFKLTSAYKEDGAPEALIFVETEGPPFYCDGAARLGQPLAK